MQKLEENLTKVESIFAAFVNDLDPVRSDVTKAEKGEISPPDTPFQTSHAQRIDQAGYRLYELKEYIEKVHGQIEL
jgi:hypothetical protein